MPRERFDGGLLDESLQTLLGRREVARVGLIHTEGDYETLNVALGAYVPRDGGRSPIPLKQQGATKKEHHGEG